VRERRFVPFEVRKVADDAPKGTFEGYGSVFGVQDSYGDVVRKGAFTNTIADWKKRGKLPKQLLQHGGGYFGGGADDMVPVGKWEEMYEDDHGLFCRGRIFDIDTDRARATYTAMVEGELDGLSIGFNTRKFERDEETGIRTLTEINLWEVSIVTFPANDPSRIDGVKSSEDLPTEREFEAWVRRELGLSKSQVELITAKGYRQLLRGGTTPSEGLVSGEAVNELLASANRRAALFQENR
jgi:HK97 family phage prohead protease